MIRVSNVVTEINIDVASQLISLLIHENLARIRMC